MASGLNTTLGSAKISSTLFKHAAFRHRVSARCGNLRASFYAAASVIRGVAVDPREVVRNSGRVPGPTGAAALPTEFKT
jgi:hypothetical protein